MDKQEFINILRASLSGKVPANVAEENIRYYEDYIASQIRMGKTEEEVLASLGDPRLLAKTAIEANKHCGNGTGNGSDYTEEETGEENEPLSARFQKLPRWLQITIVVLIALVVLSLVTRLLVFFFPLIAVLVLGGIILRLLRGTGRF